MMNLLSAIQNTGKLFNGLPGSFLAEQPSTIETVLIVIAGFISDLFMPVFNIITSVVLTLCDWALAVVDFCFVLIRQIGGLNVDYSRAENIIKDDLIFQFIFNDTIKDIINGLIILAVVVIIVLGIIAIIKSEFTAAMDTGNSGEIKNDKSKIWKNIFQSLFLLIFVPVVFIGGLVMSNAILQTILNATAGSANMTIGSQIFVASSYNANVFRAYANGNQKIPITYQFNQIKDYSSITEWDTSGSIKEIEQALKEYQQAEEWTQGFATFEMFFYSTYFDMDDIDTVQLQTTDGNNIYNLSYDKGIRTYKYEYYVNADLQDYLMKYGTAIYYKTAQEAYETCQNAGIILDISPTKAGEYVFSVDYEDDRGAITYKHKQNATDESNGAVFLACIKKEYTKQNSNETQYYYEPITLNNSEFRSMNLVDGNQYVVARGLFDGGIYPTAIKQDNGKIVFYRDKLNVPTLGSLFPHISYELPEGAHEAGGVTVLKSAIQLFTGVDVSQFVPYLYFDISLNSLFSKVSINVASLNSCGYYLDYTFSSDGVVIENFYQKVNINYAVLVLGTIIILSNVVKAFFGLIKRFVDIMFLYLVYPTAISTIPLYGDKSFKKWISKMTSKVLSLYGLMIGINLALLMIPICSTIEIFTVNDLQNSYWIITPGFSVWVLNTIAQLAFTLVGINMIFRLSSMIQQFVLPGDKSDIIKDGGDVIKGTTDLYTKAFKTISDVVTLKFAVNAVKSTIGYTDEETGQYHPGWIPGSAGVDLVNKWKETRFGFQQNKLNTQEAKNQNNENIRKAMEEAKAKKQNKNKNNQNNTNKSNANGTNNSGSASTGSGGAGSGGATP